MLDKLGAVQGLVGVRRQVTPDSLDEAIGVNNQNQNEVIFDRHADNPLGNLAVGDFDFHDFSFIHIHVRAEMAAKVAVTVGFRRRDRVVAIADAHDARGAKNGSRRKNVFVIQKGGHHDLLGGRRKWLTSLGIARRVVNPDN
jgi:hypothetical protein